MFKYTTNRNTQILLYLLKKHGIKKVVVSPGTMNVSIVASMQQDQYFELISAADERSAGYIACGMAAESGEPIVLSCTGATASRNYLPALTEAYYRKLPVLALTAAVPDYNLGQLIPQAIDRRSLQNDIIKKSVHVPVVFDDNDEVGCTDLINDALLELRRNGEGPVHINLEVRSSGALDADMLPPARYINRYTVDDVLPVIDASRIAIFVGNHKKWTTEEVSAVEDFCSARNAVVICDVTSNYFGDYRVCPHIVGNQDYYHSELLTPDLMIHIGEVSGAYLNITPKNVWRVSPDGEIRNTFKCLTAVFEMSEKTFFTSYAKSGESTDNEYYKRWRDEIQLFNNPLRDLPFSNIWVAQNTVNRLPNDAIIHFGILNSLRSWNFFADKLTLNGFCNTGGFGIDGCTSSMIGASLINEKRLVFGIVGDLSFFYDMNSLGNRHIRNNIRLMVINNGCGVEFRNYNHVAHVLGEYTDAYVAAAGHYGNKSNMLLKGYADSLGFEYISASNKEEFLNAIDIFVNPRLTEKSIVFEIFTDSDSESTALKTIRNLKSNTNEMLSNKARSMVGSILGTKGKQLIKDMIRKK